MRAEDVKPDTTRFFGMFLSRSSGGKSTAAFSFPKPILVLDSDLRKGFLGSKFLDLSQITIEPLPPLTTTWASVEKKLDSIWSLFQAGQRPYNTIIIDSITTFVRLFMTESTEVSKSQKLGFKLSGPKDYMFESQVTLQIFDYLRSMPCNVIINGHLVNVWGKDPNAKDKDGNVLEYQPDIIIGKELSIRHKLGENLLIYFDEVYEFEKSEDGKKHTVRFRSSVGRTVYDFPNGQVDITGKRFYDYWLSEVQKINGAVAK